MRAIWIVLFFSLYSLNTSAQSTSCEGVIFCDGENAGIGTDDTHGYKLAVAGEVLTEKLLVKQQSDWPDFVFDDDYKLLDLMEIEMFIKDHKHLPEVPDRYEIENNGYKLADMDKVLLKKIEELTLYVIQQNKKLQKLKAELRELKNQTNDSPTQ